MDEADVKQKKIAFTAPIAKALMGAKKGEQVNFNLGGASKTLTILDVEYLKPFL